MSDLLQPYFKMLIILCLTSITTVTSVHISKEDACYCMHNLCVNLRILIGILYPETIMTARIDALEMHFVASSVVLTAQ